MNVTRSVVAIIAAAAIYLVPGAADAHPLHTTLTEVTVDRSRHTVRAVVRVFIDDLSAGMARQRGVAPSDSLDVRATMYIESSFAIADAAGKPVALRSCGVRKNHELLWVCVEGAVPGDIRALSIKNSLLCDVFSDQVNIVNLLAFGTGQSGRSVLFTKGDRAKPLF
ncbi:MAG TPA: DUF6702 family protein [Gemmatimonadaceae bacterium]|nr:DUF6702 family protein [Gemmatimonadaceae bacterium]